MYKNILHPTDLRENHFHLCQKAITMAKIFDAELHLLHVIEPSTSLQLAQGLGFAPMNPQKEAIEQEEVQTVMQVLADSLNIPIDHCHIAIGSVYQQVLAKVEELQCELIILGKHSSHGLPALLGNSAYAIVHHTPCDVFILT